MMLRFGPAVLLVASAFSALALAQQTPIRSSASEYPAHANTAAVAIGAEYLGHSVPVANGAFITKDYLVVKVGIFPSARIAIANSQFTLRVDGDSMLPGQAPGLVASSLSNSDWHPQSNSSHSTSIILGGAPISVEPGDQQPPSRSPRAPGLGDESRSGSKMPSQSAHDAVFGDALPSGAILQPIHGLLFFHYAPKTKAAVRSLELIYDGGNGKITIRLL
jgi:hypothetical protein